MARVGRLGGGTCLAHALRASQLLECAQDDGAEKDELNRSACPGQHPFAEFERRCRPARSCRPGASRSAKGRGVPREQHGAHRADAMSEPPHVPRRRNADDPLEDRDEGRMTGRRRAETCISGMSSRNNTPVTTIQRFQRGARSRSRSSCAAASITRKFQTPSHRAGSHTTPLAKPGGNDPLRHCHSPTASQAKSAAKTNWPRSRPSTPSTTATSVPMT